MSQIEIDNQKKFESLAYLAHEFKTPLNAIIGFASLMQHNEHERDRQLKYLENISKASGHLLEIAEYTLDTARTETESQKLYCEKFNPQETLNEVMTILDEKIKGKKIKVQIKAPNICVRADKRRFKQLLYNLASNAVKYNEIGGEIRIKTFCDSKNFCFEIHNTGKIIPADEQHCIFKLFSDIENENTEKEDSSGVGLSLCKKIVELHKGEISFKSGKNSGTTFVFTLPLNG
jgi:signal transduction histidine kinase